MRRILFGAGVVLVALLPGPARADEVDALAQKQRAATYDAREEGLRTYVAEVSCSLWRSDRLLANAKLVFELATWSLEAEGLPPEAEENPRDGMVAAFTELMRRLEPLSRGVEGLREGRRVTVRKVEDGTEVVAVRTPSPDAGDQPTRVTVVLDDRFLLKSLVEEYEGHPTESCSGFLWRREGARWIASEYQLAVGDRLTTHTVEHESVGGFALPAKVSVWVNRSEVLWTFSYRSVNDQPVTSVGPFGTPEATVRSFLAACAAKDAGMVGKCFAASCDREFAPFRDVHAPPEAFAEFAATFASAKVRGVELAEDGRTAVVEIDFRRGDAEATERLEMVLDDAEWKIVAF